MGAERHLNGSTREGTYIRHTLRSWLHQISTWIRNLSPGLENNSTLNCCSNNFPTWHCGIRHLLGLGRGTTLLACLDERESGDTPTVPGLSKLPPGNQGRVCPRPGPSSSVWYSLRITPTLSIGLSFSAATPLPKRQVKSKEYTWIVVFSLASSYLYVLKIF